MKSGDQATRLQKSTHAQGEIRLPCGSVKRSGRKRRLLSQIVTVSILWAVVQFSAAAQTFTLGTTSDPCTGGLTDNYASLTPTPALTTLRYDAFGTGFSCVFPATGGPGIYSVSFTWIEAKVTTSGGRLFGLTLNGYAELQNFDIFASGGTATKTVTKTFIVNTVDGNITARLDTQARSATLFVVYIVPVAQKTYQDLFTVDCATPLKPTPNCPTPVCTLIQVNCTNGTPNTSFTASHTISCILSVKRNGLALYGARDYQLVGNVLSISGIQNGDIVELDYRGR